MAQCDVSLASAPIVVFSIIALRPRVLLVPPFAATLFRTISYGFPPSSLTSRNDNVSELRYIQSYTGVNDWKKRWFRIGTDPSYIKLSIIVGAPYRIHLFNDEQAVEWAGVFHSLFSLGARNTGIFSPRYRLRNTALRISQQRTNKLSHTVPQKLQRRDLKRSGVRLMKWHRNTWIGKSCVILWFKLYEIE